MLQSQTAELILEHRAIDLAWEGRESHMCMEKHVWSMPVWGFCFCFCFPVTEMEVCQHAYKSQSQVYENSDYEIYVTKAS